MRRKRLRDGKAPGKSLRNVDGTSPASLRHRCLLSLLQLRRTPGCRNQQGSRSGYAAKTACDPRLTYISGTQ